MLNNSIEQHLFYNQDINDNVQILSRYPIFIGSEILCPLCEGVHENSTNCQRND